MMNNISGVEGENHLYKPFIESKFILVNGPAGVGKSELFKHLKEYGPIENKPCKSHLYGLTKDFFGVDSGYFWQSYEKRELKEMPLPGYRVTMTPPERGLLEESLGISIQEGPPERGYSLVEGKGGKGFTVNLSVREAMIYVSEVIIKPRLGQDFFGKRRAEDVSRYSGKLYYDCSASAFTHREKTTLHEITPLIDKLGQDNILLLRVHMEGYDFTGDSRKYIPDGVIDNTVNIYNNGALDEFLEKSYTIVNNWLKEKECVY